MGGNSFQSFGEVLIVDDTPANIDIILATLGKDYDVLVALDGAKALEIARTLQPELILLDIVMPKMDGYEVCALLKQDPVTAPIPIIFLTAQSEVQSKTYGFELGAVDYITKPFDSLEVKSRVKTHLSLVRASKALEAQNEILEQKVKERTKELCITQNVTIQSLASLAETRDNETGGHIRRTQYYIKFLAEHLKTHPNFKAYLNDNIIELLFKSAPLHDIGKVGVPDNILLKPGRLTTEEFEKMKTHTTLGREAIRKPQEQLGGNSFLFIAQEIAFTHHEKWDGTGYPQGLKEDEIPISGRLMAVADVYDALISKRVYKSPMSKNDAADVIREGKGGHFDPDVVDCFAIVKDQFEAVAERFADS